MRSRLPIMYLGVDETAGERAGQLRACMGQIGVRGQRSPRHPLLKSTWELLTLWPCHGGHTKVLVSRKVAQKSCSAEVTRKQPVLSQGWESLCRALDPGRDQASQDCAGSAGGDCPPLPVNRMTEKSGGILFWPGTGPCYNTNCNEQG